MRTDRLIKRVLLATGCVLLLLIVACGRSGPSADRTAEWLEQGARLLSEAAVDAVPNYGGWSTRWDLERSEARVDEERFPTWAEDQYETCIYWQAPYSAKVSNRNRTPENPAVLIDRPGTAWGWILIGDRGVHFLELGYQYDDGEDEAVLTIDAWEPPQAVLEEN